MANDCIQLLFRPRAVFDVIWTRKQTKTAELLEKLSTQMNNFLKVWQGRFLLKYIHSRVSGIF